MYIKLYNLEEHPHSMMVRIGEKIHQEMREAAKREACALEALRRLQTADTKIEPSEP